MNEFLYDLFFGFFNVLSNWSMLIYNFLFEKKTIGFSIPFLNIEYSFEFILFYALGGGVAVTLLVWSIVKRFIPLA